MGMKLGLIYLLVWALAAPMSAADAAEEKQVAVPEKTPEPPPDLSAVHSPALTAALKDPEKLWQFILAPETPYTERRAAAVQGAKVFPVKWLPRLMAAIGELRAEESLHQWQLKLNPRWSYAYPLNPGHEDRKWPEAERSRHILGGVWQVPEKRSAYPQGWAEEAGAPWPWQVKQALGALYSGLYPNNEEEARAWLAITLEMPCTTDAEAALFVKASAASTHLKTVAVMARWRQIAVAAKFPKAAYLAAGYLGEAVRLWDDPQSQAIGQVILVDILTQSPHKKVREQAAYGIGSLTRRLRQKGKERGKEVRLPLPATTVLKAGQMALDPANGDAWTRLYVYAFSICEALETPPFAADRRMDPAGAEPELEQFAEWFNARKEALTAAAEKEAPELDTVRAAMDAAVEK